MEWGDSRYLIDFKAGFGERRERQSDNPRIASLLGLE
jgi:hypothetical protein